MTAIRFANTLLVLENISRVSYEENEEHLTSDDRCYVYFIGDVNDPYVVKGKYAKPVFEKLLALLKPESAEPPK